MDLNFQLGDFIIDLEENPTILVCGETGCGKSYLLKKIWKQLSRSYKDKIKFVFIDLKQVEYGNIIEGGKLLPVCLETTKVDGILDELLSKPYDLPVVVFWDVFEDYLYLHDKALSKFKKLLSDGPKKQIYTIACSSRAYLGKEYTDLFSPILLGKWYEENFNDFISDKIRNTVIDSKLDYQKLKTGEFILIQDSNTRLVKIPK